MIKINLLPQRKPKRQSDAGTRDLLIGVLAIIVLGGALFFFVQKPKMDELDKQKASNADFESELAARKKKIADLPKLEQAVAGIAVRGDSIQMLIDARAVPAHMLHELGEILTPGRLPTMTKEMAERVKKELSYQFRDDWDPKHIWITDLSETKGVFTLSGGAESDGDVAQLAKRMQASTYFQEVSPTGGEKVTDKETNLTYYTFTIKGKVVY
jgi:type IV pilus assembly protein PilN